MGDLGPHTDAGTAVIKVFFPPVPSKSGPGEGMCFHFTGHVECSQMLGGGREDFLEVLIKAPETERRKIPPWCYRCPRPVPGAIYNHRALTSVDLCPPAPGPEKPGPWGSPKHLPSSLRT